MKRAEVHHLGSQSKHLRSDVVYFDFNLNELKMCLHENKTREKPGLKNELFVVYT